MDLVYFKFAIELQLWAIMFTACPRTLCTGAPLFLVVLQTYSLCTAFLPRRSQYSPFVCIKHQACRTAGAGPSTLRQSQPSVEGDRTVRWPPQGTEQFLLLMHPRRQDWSAPSSSLPPSLYRSIPPFTSTFHPILPSHLHLIENTLLSSLAHLHRGFCALSTSFSSSPTQAYIPVRMLCLL